MNAHFSHFLINLLQIFHKKGGPGPLGPSPKSATGYLDSGSNSLVTEKYGGFNACKKLWVWIWIGQSDAVIKVIWLESVAADHHWSSISKSSQVLSYGFKIYILKKCIKTVLSFHYLVSIKFYDYVLLVAKSQNTYCLQ